MNGFMIYSRLKYPYYFGEYEYSFTNGFITNEVTSKFIVVNTNVL